jgi:hypothetical protein
MSVLHPSSICPFLIFRPRHHVFPNVSSSNRKTVLLSNDGVLPTAGIFTECFEENFLSNGVFLPNSAHRSVSFLYQFLVLTPSITPERGDTTTMPPRRYTVPEGVAVVKTEDPAWLSPMSPIPRHVTEGYREARPCNPDVRGGGQKIRCRG